MAKDDDILEEARELFAQCEEREADNRDEALDDLEFARLARQWRPEDEEQRASEGRPCLTINRMPAFIRQVVNDARQNTPSISVRAVDDAADPATAEVMSDLIRDIEAQSDADIAYDTAVDSAVSCGFGYFRINTAYASDDAFDQDIRIARIANPFSVYGDPFSDAPDSSDWNVAFVLDKMTRSQFERRFKGADLVSWADPRWEMLDEPWKSEGDFVGVAEYWLREEVKKPIIALSNGMIVAVKEYEDNKALFDAQGVSVIGSPRDVVSHKVTQRLISGCDVLETTEWAGKYIPIVPVYGEEINVAGTRYLRSLIRDAKDPQRMFNYWRTASTELVALAPKTPWIGKRGTFKSDAAKWATANRASHPYIEYDGERPERLPFAGTPVGVINEALAASDDMKAIMGLHDASLGARSNETSGRAIMMRQREGDVSTFHFQDNLNRAIRHGGRILVDLIPKVYATARMVRVLGEDKKSRLIKLNQKHVEGGVERLFDLSVGRYDLAVQAGPSFTSRREEAATQMMQLIQAFPQAAPVIGDLVAEKLDWPGANEIARRLKTLLPPGLREGDSAGVAQGAQQGGAAAQGLPPQAQQAVMQARQIIESLKGALAQTKGKMGAMEADRWADSMRVMIDAYEAQTERMKLMGAAAPSPIQNPPITPAQTAPQSGQQPAH
jgi:hypothetical protein